MLKETMIHWRLLYFTTIFIQFGYCGSAQESRDSIRKVFLKIKGTYCHRGQSYTNCITFINDSLFDYSLSNYVDDGYHEQGKGIYKRDCDKLILSFCYADSLKTSSYRSSITKCKTRDSLSVKFLIQDSYSNEQISFAEIAITDSANFSKKLKTDFDGNSQTDIPKSINSLFVSINYIGFEKYSFKLSSNKCQSINIKLSNLWRIVPEGTKMTYEITNITSSELQLKKGDSNLNFIKEQ